MKTKNGATGPLLCLLASAIWGLAFPFQRAAGEVLSAFTVTAARSAVAALFLFCAVPLFDRLSKNGRRLFSRCGRLPLPDLRRSEWLGGILCGLALGTASILQQIGISVGGNSGRAAFITTLYVALVPLFGLFVGRRTPPLVLCGTGGALVGAALLAVRFDTGVGPALGIGDLFVLASAAVFAVHILLIDRFSPKADGIRMSGVQFLTIALLLFPSYFLEVPMGGGWAEGLLPILYLGVMSSGIAYTLQIVAQGRTHPAVASTLLSLESVFGLFFSWLLYGETLTDQQWLGSAVLLLSVLVAQLGGRKNAISS